MRKWCCFSCFGEFDRETSNTMEGDSDHTLKDNNLGENGSNRNNNEEKDENSLAESLELGFFLGLHDVKSCDDNNNGKNVVGLKRERSVCEMLELSLGGSSSRVSEHKRAKLETAIDECRFAGVGLLADDGYESYDDFLVQQDKMQRLFASLVDVTTCGHNSGLGAIKCNIDNSNMDVQMDLSDDLLHMVFSFLGHGDLCRSAMVCKQWRAASAHEDFWRLLDFENRNVSVGQLEDICHRYPRAVEVNLCGNPDLHFLVMRTASMLRNLEALTIGKGHLGEAFFHALSDCPSLKRLVVCDAALGNGVQEIFINHDMLRHLQVTKCRVLRVSVRCPQLETLSLKRSNMAHVVLYCPLLRNLDIGSCHKLPDTAIRSAVITCPRLEYLDMSNCSCVSDETLREIAQACASLHELNASYCPNISLESVRMLLLTVLRLESCEGITSASMTAIAYSNMLEVLELDNCNLLMSVSLELPHLRNLRLVHCRKFVDLNLRCSTLSSLTVSNCPALNRISLFSNALKKLALHKQESLKSLSLHCQYLEEVDLSDCEALTDFVCDVFSDGGGCPMLKSLILDNCESLTDVGLHSASLACLSLIGCRGITSLNLTCPYLEQVRLDGCDHLERASFFQVGLQSLNLGICPKLNALHIEAPRMIGLELKGCGVLSEVSIDCPLLTSLDASFCSQLEDGCLSATAASCPRIQKLVLMSCPSIGSDGLSTLSLLTNLTYLDLSYTFLMDLEPVFKSCLRLTVLKLQACKYLNNSSLDALKDGALPALRELDLSYGTLCQSAIEELLAYCTHLTHLSLNGCINMHDLNWGLVSSSSCQTPGVVTILPLDDPAELPHRLLQNLNCVGCSNIKKVYIPSTSQCVYLSSLNLSLSVNLKEVDISCPNLCFLNLSNCSSLEYLRLECPKLTSLFLQKNVIVIDDDDSIETINDTCFTIDELLSTAIETESVVQLASKSPKIDYFCKHDWVEGYTS